jgi:hypothetical protein
VASEAVHGFGKTLCALALWSLLFGFASASVDVEPRSSVKDGAWLLRQLKALADDEAFLSLDKVGTALSFTLDGTSHEIVPQPPNCSNPHSDKSRIVTDYLIKNSWYRLTSEGLPHMKFPGAFINPPGEVGDPQIAYHIMKTASCSGKFDVANRSSAEISFSGLPAFACLSPSDLKNQLHAEYQMGTDGVSVSTYQAVANDQFGTRITFFFRMGAVCALSAQIEQDSEFSYRYLRAAAKFKDCTKHVDHDFCATHPPFSWGEGDKIDEMNEAAAKVCGGLDSFYEKEPPSGDAPPAQPPYWSVPHRTPCDGK